MIKKTAVTLMLMMSLTAMLLTSGCLIAAVGAAGGVFYAKGDLETTLEAAPEKIAAATEKAFADLKISKTSSVSSDLEAEITGRTATDKKVIVIIKAKSDKFSSISIRVVTFGDEDLSQTIFAKIKKNL